MANLIDILINASWLGSSAISDAKGGLRGMSDAAASSAVEMSVMRDKTKDLNNMLGVLTQEVRAGEKTVEQATEEYKGAAEALGLMAEEAPKTSRGLSDLVATFGAATIAIGGTVVVAKKLYDFLREGAELELTRSRFDKLAQSIGTTSDALDSDLRYATQGLIPDIQALALATDFMSQGIATTHDEAVRLTGISAQLGINMNQLLNVLTSRTTAGFDELGISVDGFAGKVKELEEAGYDADRAFDMAFIEQAEEQIERIGSRADSTAGQIDMIGVAWTNAMNVIKESTAESLGPFVELLVSGIMAAGDAQGAAVDFGEASGIREQAAAFHQYTEAVDDFKRRGQFGLDPSGNERKLRQALLDMVVSLVDTEGSAEAATKRLEELGATVDEDAIKVGRYKVSWQDVEEVLSNVRLEAQASWDAFERLGDKTLTPISTPLTEEMIKLQEQINAIEFNELLDEIGITNDEFIKLAYHMGGTAEAEEYLKGVLASATPINMEYAASLARIDEKMVAIGMTAAGLEKLMAPLFEERAELFQDFQLDLSDISQSEGEERASTEAQYEQRRTDIVEQYGARRAQAEEDYQLRQVRNAAKLAGDIEDAQEDSYERQAEIREGANQRFADLERDHADRLTDIIRDADDSLTEAAGRLDASAIVSITRRRDRALEDEEQAYQRSHENIQRTLDDQLAAEQLAAIGRIDDMQSYFIERQQLDEEDHQLRLDRLESANIEQLAVLEEKTAQELIEIQNAASLARGMREIAYFNERTALGDHLGDKAKQEAQLQKDLLIAEEKWWKERTALIPNAGADAANLPAEFFGAGPSRLELNAPINIYIEGATDPEATGLSVREELLGLFGSFTE